MQSRNIPWRQAVEKVFAPLIETQQDPDNPGESFCYLFHSTVRDFLISNKSIFKQESPNLAVHAISEITIANACLLYLSQDRYAQLLTKEAEVWVTASKDKIEDHHLLTYSAKYWDKHFDNVEETVELRQRIEKFLTSSNFQLTMQLQSLFVQGHFDVYDGGVSHQKLTKRVFPRWFAGHSTTETGCSPFSRDYRSFISEWDSLLRCPGCEDPRCYPHWAVKQSKGELDRCLWCALGPRNFLSSNRGRYTSFMMCDEENFRSGTLPYHEVISQDGSKALVLQQTDEADPTFNHKLWELSGLAKSVLPGVTTTISERFNGESWADANLRSIASTLDLAFLRIGSQIYSLNGEGAYCAVDGLDISSQYPNNCFEDIASRGSLLVVASRRKMPATTDSRGRTAVREHQPSDRLISSADTPDTDSKLGKDLEVTTCRHCSREPSKSNRDSDISPAKGNDSSTKDGSDSDTSSLSDEISEWNSAEESWSEGSTEVDELGNPLSSSDEASSSSSEADTDSDVKSDTPEDDAVSDTAINSYGQLYEESDSDGGDVDFDCGSDSESYDGDYESDWSDYNNADEDLHFDSDDEERLVRQMAYSRQDRKRGAKVPQGVLTIYDLAASPPTQIFTFAHQLPIMLYDSPPVLHPTEPLVVWPLCGGDVLFADFVGKSYFIRRSRTTTRKSKPLYQN